MANDDEQPATHAQVKRAIRAKLRRHPEHEEYFLNIYPMMDMMTILLVFLLMTFANATADIVSDESQLQLPYSVSKSETEDSETVVVSRSEIMFNNEKVCELRNGQVDPSQKQGGGSGFLISPLLTRLENRRDQLKAIASLNPIRAFEGDVRIVADKETPYRTITEVIYTLGQSEFKSIRFVLLPQVAKQKGFGL